MDNGRIAASDQVIGGVVGEVNLRRQEHLAEMLKNIGFIKKANLNAQDDNFTNAMNAVNEARDFLRDPSKILGSDLTKHGEIAESLEVNIGNARDLLRGLPKRFSFDGVGRTAPEDFIMDGIKAQSKFYNSEDATLSAVLKHMEKYKDIDFGRDGSRYVIPKDFFENIRALRNGQNPSGYSPREIAAILGKVKQIEDEAQKSFDEVVAASRLNYKDVQMDAAPQTIDKEEMSIKSENKGIKKGIAKESDKDKGAAIKKSAPGLGEATKVAAISAAFEGTAATALLMYCKHKNLRDYDVEDWKEVGITFGEGALKGGVRGYAMYGLSNCAKMPAPLAAAYVSAAFGVAQIYSSYSDGKIGAEEAIQQGEILCFDVTLSLIGSSIGKSLLSKAIGQALIPVPILGAVVGSIAANVFGSIIKNELNKREEKLIALSRARYEEAAGKLDRELADYLEKLLKKVKVIWDLSQAAFDYKLNASLRFEASQKLAYAHGVSEDKVLKTVEDIDDYFLK